MLLGGYYFFGFHQTEKQRDNLRRNLPPDYDSGGETPVDENDNAISKKLDSDKSLILNNIYLRLKLKEKYKAIKSQVIVISYKDEVYGLKLYDDVVWMIGENLKKIIELEKLPAEDVIEIYRDIINWYDKIEDALYEN